MCYVNLLEMLVSSGSWCAGIVLNKTRCEWCDPGYRVRYLRAIAPGLGVTSGARAVCAPICARDCHMMS